MSAFAFELRQRVIVPKTDGAQGEVMRRTESVEGPPNYKLHWSVVGRPQSGWFAENDITAANPPLPTISADNARKISDELADLEAATGGKPASYIVPLGGKSLVMRNQYPRKPATSGGRSKSIKKSGKRKGKR